MFIQPWDAAQEESEWRSWIESGGKFGILAIPALETGMAPTMVPSHFSLREKEILMHLARPNKALPLLEQAKEVAFTVYGDYAFVNNQWRAKPGIPKQDGVPTSYYAAVNFVCRPTVISDEAEMAEILKVQMADMAPQGGYADIAPDAAPYGPMLSGIRAVRLEILSVEAKFKYDDHKPMELRENVNSELEARAQGQDLGAAQQQRRRMESMGEWNK